MPRPHAIAHRSASLLPAAAAAVAAAAAAEPTTPCRPARLNTGTANAAEDVDAESEKPVSPPSVC
eukprot:365057-Chlamydomonas_euryale.AAC.5